METRIRAGAIIIRDGKLLMVTGRARDELWTPGGKIESGESDEECLKRELKEEVGMELVEMKFFKEYFSEHFYEPGKISQQRIYIVSATGEPKLGAEIEKIIWLTREDFEKKKYPMITINEKEIIPDLIKQNIF